MEASVESAGYARGHAAFRARHSQSGIGAAVVEFRFDAERDEHQWWCVVSDGDQYRYLEVCSRELGPWQRLSPTVVEEAIERFARTLPDHHRLYHLVSAGPLHLSRDGTAHIGS